MTESELLTPDGPTHEGVRTRTVRWTDPARARFHLRGRDGFDQMRALIDGAAAPPPVAALLGMHIEHNGCIQPYRLAHSASAL